MLCFGFVSRLSELCIFHAWLCRAFFIFGVDRMTKVKQHIYDLDEILVLCLLEECEMTHRQVREELIKLTDGAPRTVNYVTSLLYGLRKDKCILQTQQTKTRTIYSITEEGRVNLRDRLNVFRTYDRLLIPKTQTDERLRFRLTTPVGFENKFDYFLEHSAYDHAQDVLFSLLREAYKAGWSAAGGKAPDPKITAIMDQRPRSAEDILY